MDKLLTYEMAQQKLNCCRTKLFELMKANVLERKQIGSRNFVTMHSVEMYIQNKPKRNSYIELSYSKKAVV